MNIIRRITDKPVAVGFGVSTPDEARAVGAISDGVVVGSAIVKKAQAGVDGGLRDFILKLREAVK